MRTRAPIVNDPAHRQRRIAHAAVLDGAMAKRAGASRARLAAVACLLAGAMASADAPPAGRLNFVSCPIVRDTKTVPCWLAEHDGELYYLGIQTDISADFDPPYLGHRVLVEGRLADAPRICGGLVLEPVMTSVLPELDGTCNTILPAEDRYQVPFAPRPPGPSGGRLAFQAPAPAAPPPPPSGTGEFVIHYDFDMLIMGRHSGVLTRIFEHARAVDARRIVIDGRRGATLLSDESVMTEPAGLAEKRARQVAALLAGAGLDPDRFEIRWSEDLDDPDGVEDWQTRQTIVRVEP